MPRKITPGSPKTPASVPPEILSRKGARTTASVPKEVLELLNAGLIESVNLCEWLIVDHAKLADTVFQQFGWNDLQRDIESALNGLKAPTAMKRTVAVGAVLSQYHSSASAFAQAIKSLSQHPSDTVRTWACAMIGQRKSLDLSRRLEWLRPLAADSNMGVREIAWMAVRPQVNEQLEEAIQQLQPWVLDPNDRIRRFASELTRPRGVWCAHIVKLKESPEMGLPLLRPLRSDDSKYVQDSVANWLNDASKSRPDFVTYTCREWLEESSTKATLTIVRRALRTLRKAGRIDALLNAML